MRLLERNNNGEFSLTKEFINDIPRYAILSHTWGLDADECTFKDLEDGAGKDKLGYRKIRFCGQQAERDGLQYFWVDTCCIDKSNSTKLAEAINSMFRWYRDAATCYVYLSDVSRPDFDTEDKSIQLPRDRALRRSRWFTRGWTLQELIAPASVEFFSKDWDRLGNKASLERQICEITGIPAKALRESHLSHFSVTERMSWAENRRTTCKEDKAYSLLGIFDIQMPLIYGEGEEKALKRLQEEINKASKGRSFSCNTSNYSTVFQDTLFQKLLTEIGIQREDFSIAFSLANVPGIEHFVARERELAEMHRALTTSDGSRRTVILHGLGGIGKTQLSIAYAKRYKDNYSAIFWLNIKDEDCLKQSLAKIARRILQDHPLSSRLNTIDIEGDLDKVVDAVKAWLSLPGNTRWLMVYDNYDNPKSTSNPDPAAVDIRRFLPESYQGSVIITTRSSLVKIGRRIHVEKFSDVQDSLQILLNESQREDSITGTDIPRRIGEVLTVMTDLDALALAKKLDGLPLALATAGAYLDQVSTSFSEYLRLFDESWLQLLENSPDLDCYEERALYTTWDLSFNHVKKQNMLSAKLLQLWAYFDNQDVWYELLQHSDSNVPDWFSYLTKDELNFTQAVRVLCNHGLVEAEKSSEERLESAGYSMHECVHSWTIHVLNRDWNFEMAKLAFQCIGLHVPDQTARSGWLTQRRILQHALKCSKMLSRGLINDNGMERELNNLGLLYTSQGKLEEAEKMFQRALQGYKKALGAEHLSTLGIVNNLGALYADLGKLDEAKKMYQRALQGYEKALGAHHTSTLDIVNNLGLLYVDLGKLDEAKKMYERALQGYEKALDAEHTSTLNTVNNLGALYADLGKLEEAEKMYQRALQGYEKALGADHTSTLSTVNNLGLLYTSLGKLEEAEKMYQRALQGYEKVLGADHTLTLRTVNNLGLLYASLSKLEDAEKMYQRALQGHEKALGADHTSTLSIVNNLGLLYVDLGKVEDAEKMYERALQGHEKALGADHIITLRTVNNLGALYASLGKLEEAEKTYQRTVQGYEKALGADHTSTLRIVSNLGDVFSKRCYAAAKILSRNMVLAYIKQIADLCMKFPCSRLRLFGVIGHAFVWIGDDEKAAAAFSHQLALSSPQCNASCDECLIRLNLETGRFVCRVCEDVDLCSNCFEKLKSNELMEVLSSCQSHKFFRSNSIIGGSASTNDADTSASSEQWLKDITNL